MTHQNSDHSDVQNKPASHQKIDDPSLSNDTPPTKPLPPETEAELGDVEEALESTTIGIEDRS